VFYTKYYYDDQMKDDKIGGRCRMQGQVTNVYKISFAESSFYTFFVP